MVGGVANTVKTPYSTIELKRLSAHCTEVWLSRPDLRNAINEVMFTELTDAFQRIAADEDARVVVLRGKGPAFCAGGDLNYMRRMGGNSWEENRRDALLASELWHTIYECPVPVIGQIHGACYAGGMGLAAVCDIVLASNAASFCLSEARIGLLPATISPYVIKAMGEQAARRYFVTAERFSAAQALATGLVHEVCEPGDLGARVEGITQGILANGPRAVRACKSLVREIAGKVVDEDLRGRSAELLANLRATPEGQEGVQAFLSKRPPKWLAGSV